MKKESSNSESSKPGGTSFFWKLWGSYALLTLASAILIALLINRFFSNTANAALRAELSTIGELAASMASSNPQGLWTGALQARLAEVSEDTNTTADIVLASGEVKMASQQGSVLPEDPLDLPEFWNARSKGKGESEYILENGERYIYVIMPILVQSDKIGYVRIGSSTKEMLAQSRELNSKVAIGASGAAFLSLLVGFFIARSATQPLSQVESACRRIAEGELSLRIDLDRKDEFGMVARSVNALADSSENQLTQLGLQRNRLALLLQLLQDSVVAIDRRGKVIFLNAAAASLFEVDESEAEGKLFEDVMRVEPIRKLVQDGFSENKRFEFETSWGEKESLRYVSIFVAPLSRSLMEKSGRLVVIRDVTESRRFEALRRDFASNVSHELKTPVAAITTLVDALETGADEDAAARHEFLGRIRIQNGRLLRLIEELLAISRLETDTSMISLRRMDLRSVMEVASETFNTMAALRGIRFETKCPLQPLFVEGDQKSLEVVVNSLVDNAFKYTGENGNIQLSLNEEGDNHCIRVQDTGIGIASRHLERIFERFYRIDVSRSRERGGSGLGLSIVKHLTVAHGGTVSVESEQGKGSLFAVSLPKAKEV